MKWTQTLIPTLREAPSDAEILSHKLLLRAGLIRKLAGGVYTFMPLGLRALRKVENIIREEMDKAGAIEVLMPALQPKEIWEASGRAETASNVLFKVKDSAARTWFLSPTAERKSSPRWPPAKSIPTGSCRRIFIRSARSFATKSGRVSA